VSLIFVVVKDGWSSIGRADDEMEVAVECCNVVIVAGGEECLCLIDDVGGWVVALSERGRVMIPARTLPQHVLLQGSF
jgi:hypothetical protein